jgi:hypothetical protein
MLCGASVFVWQLFLNTVGKLVYFCVLDMSSWRCDFKCWQRHYGFTCASITKMLFDVALLSMWLSYLSVVVLLDSTVIRP